MNILKVLGLTMTLLLLAAGCAGSSGADSGGGNDGGENSVNVESSAGNTSAQSETAGTNVTTGEVRVNPGITGDTVGGTAGPSGATVGGATAPSQTGDVRVEQLSSGAMGPEERQVLIATSAGNLAAATGVEVPDRGKGTYLAVAWGEKSTGGYTVGFDSARMEGVEAVVNVALKDPPPDAMVAQAITYPYAVAFLPGVDPGEHKFVFVTQNGRRIGWPVRSV